MISPVLLLPFIQGCSEVRISPGDEALTNLSSKGTICTEVPQEIGQYSNVMFVVDKSGSNVTGGNGGTDPNKEIRGNAIQDFFARHRDNPYIKWGLVEFHNDRAKSYVPEQGGPNLYFTEDALVMEQAIAAFLAEPDSGGTPYRQALNLTTSAIRAEFQREEELIANYNIIFLSDGEPTDYQNDQALYTDVANLVNISRGNIHLSTVYYGPPNPGAEIRLETMAEVGLGMFQNTNIDPLIQIDDLIVGRSSSEPYLIKKFGVYNLNAGLCDDGSVGSDSDADGLCDKDELRYNQLYANDPVRAQRMNGRLFDPVNRNSFDDQFSDSFYYRYIVYNEALPVGCMNDDDDDIDLVNNCEEKFLFNQNPQGPTESWTQRMIERGKEADSLNFDSDGDGVLDYLEFIFFKNKSTAMNYNNLFERTNGHDNEYLIMNHLNPLNPMSSKPYQGSFKRVDPNSEGQNCYQYSQKNLTLYQTRSVASVQTSGYYQLAHGTNENIVLIYFIQTPEYAPHSKGFLRYSFQKLKAGQDGPSSLNLNPALFDIYPR